MFLKKNAQSITSYQSTNDTAENLSHYFTVSSWEVGQASALFLAIVPSLILIIMGVVLRKYVSGLDWVMEQAPVFTAVPVDPVSSKQHTFIFLCFSAVPIRLYTHRLIG